MTIALLITIDVESDDLWAGRAEVTLENIRAMPRLHAFFGRMGVIPTYLLSYPVATSAVGREVFGPVARDGTGEIGSHMHVWTTPPLREISGRDHAYGPLASELSYDEVHAKLASVTAAVGELAGYAPVSHRAGRYALDGAGLRALEALGYRADTSVAPMMSWTFPRHGGGTRGPDYRRAPIAPYYPSRDAVDRPGDSPVLQVPLSYYLTRRLPLGLTERVARLPRNATVARALRWSGVARLGWLRPGRDTSARQMVNVAETLIADGCPVLNVMFHSSEMALGTSPHTRTEADVEDSYRQLEGLFRALLARGDVTPMTLGGYAEHYAATQAGRPGKGA